MNITEILKKIPTEEEKQLYWVDDFPQCQKCRSANVLHDGDLCKFCQMESERGYEALTMTGRCASGAQRDAGTLYHAVKIGEWKAICGAKHGKRSRWSEYHGKDVTCSRCLKKL